jgi:predicted nucleotidyltransferase
MTMHRRQPAVSKLLEALVADIQAALGDDLVAVYLYGSCVSGGFDVGVSDLDLVAVTGHEADTVDLVGLGAMHSAFATRHPDWTDRIEVVYVSRNALRAFRTSAGHLAVVSPGEPFHLRDDRPAEWIQNWYLVRETGIALFGPPPASLIPHVAWSEFVAASKRYAAELADNDLYSSSPGYLAYVVLTMCRVERAVAAGTRSSKQDAAIWARQRHPESAWLIDAALRCRLARGSFDFDDTATRSAAVEFIRSIAVRTSRWPAG